MTTFGKLGPAQGFLQSLAHVACSTGLVECCLWLSIVQQYLSCVSVRGRGIVFGYYYQSMAKSAWGVGTAWMDVLPTMETWELDATVMSALRFQLGVSPGPPSHAPVTIRAVIPTMQ